MELIHLTAQYSNAVLVAVLPFVSQFASKLELPVQQPISVDQVKWSGIIPYKDFIEVGLTLTNGYWFRIEHRGFVSDCRAPTNWFFEQEFTDESIRRYLGHDNMTTNEVISMARGILAKLGYEPELTHCDEVPTLEGPFDLHRKGIAGHVPYCRAIWEWPKTDNLADLNQIKVEINMESKALVGLHLTFSRTNDLRSVPVKVDVVPELESDFQRRRLKSTGKMFINTNAPSQFPGRSH